MRTTNFYNDPSIDDINFAGFSIVRDVILISGGHDLNPDPENTDSFKNYRSTYLI